MKKSKESEIQRLAKKVVALRKAKGWSGLEFGRQTGLSVPMIRRIENARTWPQMRVLQSVATALGVKIGDLFI